MVQLSQPYMTTGKTIALTVWTFVGKVRSLRFNTLSRFVITFLPRSKHLLISWLQSPSAVILEPKKRKSISTSTFFPSIWCEVMGPDTMILVFFIFSFKPALSRSSFTLIKKLFSSSLLSAIRVVSPAYLRLLMFLLPILIVACNSFSPAFLMMCSVHGLNKHGTYFCFKNGGSLFIWQPNITGPLYFFLIFIYLLGCLRFIVSCGIFPCSADSLVVVHGLNCPKAYVILVLWPDRTHVPCNARQTPNQWATREVPGSVFFLLY